MSTSRAALSTRVSSLLGCGRHVVCWWSLAELSRDVEKREDFVFL